jgi:hypothetical protein
VKGNGRARILAAAVTASAALTALTWSPATAGAAGVQRVSNEHSWTLWAYVDRSATVRAAPSGSAEPRGKVRRETFSGSAEVVLVLRSRVVARRSWLRIRYPGLGRRVGWVAADAIGPTHAVTTHVVVDRARREVRLYRDGELAFRVPAGVGASASPTPAGRSYVRERLVPVAKDGIYGVLAFGLAAYSRYRTDWPGGGQVGLHGTNQPELIPGWISNGCIRVRNAAIRRLDRQISVGTPVKIL